MASCEPLTTGNSVVSFSLLNTRTWDGHHERFPRTPRHHASHLRRGDLPRRLLHVEKTQATQAILILHRTRNLYSRVFATWRNDDRWICSDSGGPSGWHIHGTTCFSAKIGWFRNFPIFVDISMVKTKNLFTSLHTLTYKFRNFLELRYKPYVPRLSEVPKSSKVPKFDLFLDHFTVLISTTVCHFETDTKTPLWFRNLG